MAWSNPPESDEGRPDVSVVVPFRGDRLAAHRLAAALACLELGDGDDAIVADNTADGAARWIARDGIRVVRATRERSAYHARNAGARVARVVGRALAGRADHPDSVARDPARRAVGGVVRDDRVVAVAQLEACESRRQAVRGEAVAPERHHDADVRPSLIGLWGI